MLSIFRSILKRSEGMAPRPHAAFMKEGLSPFFTNWRPLLRNAREDVRASWPQATARAIDLFQNSGFISGGIEQAVAYTVGTGLNLNAQPDCAALNMSQQEAHDWSRLVERRFELWANRPLECDVEGRRTLGQMAATSFRQWFATGEILALVRWKSLPGSRYNTKLQLLSPSQLSQNSLYPNLFQGVRCDADGYAISYLFNNLRADQFQNMKQVEIKARDKTGRARVIHVFEGMPGQIRGITPLAPALKVARQFDQLADATLTAALIQAILVATITSDTPTPDLMESLRDPQEQMGGLAGLMGARADYYDRSKIDIGRFGKIAHLFTGDKFEFHGSQHPNSQYEAFASFLLREVARCLGVTYEDLTGDYRGATYSSVRMATAAMWLIVLSRRSFIVAPFLQEAYEAWLEEAIECGDVPFPGGLDAFLAQRTAVCRAKWKGLGRPQADDLKTAKAQQIWKDMGVISDEMIANEFGMDLEDLYEQLERERQMRKERGIEEMSETAKEPRNPTESADEPI